MVVTLEGLAGLALDIILLQRRDGFSDKEFFFFFFFFFFGMLWEELFVKIEVLKMNTFYQTLCDTKL